MDGGRSTFPAPLARVREQFDEWRRTRRQRTIPEGLWSAATRLAREHGVGYTSRALRLDYYGLKRRLESICDADAKPRARFVELALPKPERPDPGCAGVAELSNDQGGRMRIEWRGSAPDLAALSRSFFGGES